jgi:shikimate dehydrogenase
VEIPPGTRFVAVVGDPVAHTLSPRMHAAAFQARGLPWAYLALRVPAGALREAVVGLVALGFEGANVTLPHKVAVCDLADELDVSARRCGAANTLVFRTGRVLAYNTDVEGCARALAEAGVDVAGTSVAVLGAGGAARAACVALAERGARRVAVLARDPRRAEALCAQMRGLFPQTAFDGYPMEHTWLRTALRASSLLVNATPVGMHPASEQSPLQDARWLRPPLVVFDMVYNPPQTRLLQQAAKMGCRTVGGLSMLVHQGAAAFELWTGTEAPVEAMKRAVGLVPAEV